MKRRVVKHGPATLTVSLPKKWVDTFHIQNGQEIDVTEDGQSLIISASAHHIKKQVTLSIDSLDRTLLMYTIRGYYRYGVDELTLNFKQPTLNYGRSSTKQTVKSIVEQELQRLMGFEVVHESQNTITIRCVQQPTFSDFDTILRRIFLLLKISAKSLEKPMTTVALADIEQSHDQITKFVSYCLRVLNISHHPDFHQTTYYYHTIGSLDRVMDFVKYAAREINKKKISSTAYEFISSTNKVIEGFYDFFFAFSLPDATKINEKRYQLETALSKASLSSRDMMICAKYSTIAELILDLVEARMALEQKKLEVA